MERPHRLAAWPTVLALGACTMVGSAPPAPAPVAAPSATSDEGRPAAMVPSPRGRVGPLPSSSGSDSSELFDDLPEEPLAAYGNMDEYEQSGRRYRVLNTSKGYDRRGVASWYGEPFHGRRTSSGETYDMNEFTAAHRTLPLPSYIEVTNLENGRKVVLRVNDRGPFHQPDERILDVSYAAAVELGMIGGGTARVRVRTVGPVQERK